MTYQFSQRSLDNLRGVHPDLVACVVACLYRYSTVDFVVTEGVRTIEKQERMVRQGRSQTMDSYHLEQKDGFAHAVDLAPWIQGEIPWDNWKAFKDIASAMKMAAKYLDIQITWGGDWETLKDGPHFQIERG